MRRDEASDRRPGWSGKTWLGIALAVAAAVAIVIAVVAASGGSGGLY